ncbi:kinase-like protein [Aspergillus coremiiformis]|uniref:Kinase-like protein n=1 Tax=Aspergillus coremiiformis TaxID=138285 RepID=A0A5N6Z422_9EURO|nr:kinase-like protein [Aspergillus coremiiformis]
MDKTSIEPSTPSGQPRRSLIAVGAASAIFAIDSDFVLKRHVNSPDNFGVMAYNIEIRAYERLGNHPQIANCREVTDDGIILERGECLRRTIQSKGPTITMQTRLRWAREAAEGLRYIHQQNIVHADIGCHNLIVDRLGHIKFIDFGGSGIDGEAALVCYEWCSYKPGSEPDIKTDIFALGSTLFEIESSKKPYHELEETLDFRQLGRRVEHLFTLRQYPSVDMLILGHIIVRCWDGYYGSMDEVWSDIDACS